MHQVAYGDVDSGTRLSFSHFIKNQGASMSISRNLTDHDSVSNFEKANLGPGVYVLFDGRVADTSIVYIGKSTQEILMRVSAHQREKDFDRVGVILPSTTNSVFIHNLEHLVVAEFMDRFGELPTYNTVTPQAHPEGRRFDWHNISHRYSEVAFLGDDEDYGGVITFCVCAGCAECTSRYRSCTREVRSKGRRECYKCRSG